MVVYMIYVKYKDRQEVENKQKKTHKRRKKKRF